MPPSPKLDRCVILYDLNCQNQNKLRKAILKIYSHYFFKGSKDTVNLVLVNSEKTENRKNRAIGKGYLNIYEVSNDALLYDPKFVQEKIEVRNAETANWREALNVAIEILKQDNTPKVITYKILFLSDFSTLSQSDEKMHNLIEELNVNDIFLYLVGPQVNFPKTITGFDGMKSLIHESNFENINENLTEAKQLILSCKNAVIADVNVGLQLFFNHKNPVGKQPWTVPLTFGTKIEYEVGTSKYIEKCSGYQLKQIDFGQKKSIYVSAADVTKEYAEEDVRKGILKHGKFIPLASNDIFKEPSERTFSLVFITKVNNIPEYMMKGPGCYTVVSANKSNPAAFHSLVSRLYDLESCIIAKRVYSKASSPIYMALLPVPSKKYLRAVQVAFGNEVSFDWMEQEPQKEVEEDISGPVKDFLDQVTLNSETCVLNCALTPNCFKSSRGEVYLNMAAAKLLQEPNLRLEEVDLDPFETGINDEIGQSLREMWPSRGLPEVSETYENSSDDEDEDYF